MILKRYADLIETRIDKINKMRSIINDNSNEGQFVKVLISKKDLQIEEDSLKKLLTDKFWLEEIEKENKVLALKLLGLKDLPSDPVPEIDEPIDIKNYYNCTECDSYIRENNWDRSYCPICGNYLNVGK